MPWSNTNHIMPQDIQTWAYDLSCYYINTKTIRIMSLNWNNEFMNQTLRLLKLEVD